MKAKLLAAPLVLFLISIPTAYSQDQPRVATFSPQGVVKRVRQVRVRFSEAMVAFGDLRDTATPFQVSCPGQGEARWVDERNWSYDFARDLPGGIRCEFRLIDRLKTLAGRDVTGQRLFSFTTGGPAILRAIPYEGAEHVAEDQIFVLELDGEASEASVVSNVWFSVQGISERVGIRIVSGKEREDILKAEFRYEREYPEHLLLIQSKQRFPAGAKISLVWGRGVASPAGVAGQVDRALPFVTQTPFMATFECTRENPEAQCVPISSMAVQFSAPVSWDSVKNSILTGPEGRKWTPAPPEQPGDNFATHVIFNGPFPERSEFVVHIPAGIKDDSGRTLTNAGSYPLTVHTDEYPPLAKFAAEFGIIELKSEPMLPVTLRNIEPQVSARMLMVQGGATSAVPVQPVNQRAQAGIQGRIVRIPTDKASQMLFWIGKIRDRNWDDRDKSIFGPDQSSSAQLFSIPKPQGPKAFEVVGIPMKTAGFYVVEIESAILGASLLGQSKPMFVQTAALVTNLSVHFKWGIDSSLIWVTTLDKAKPAAGAAVQIQNCEGQIVWQGKTDRNGIARTGVLPRNEELPDCPFEGFNSGLVVTARLGEDFSFVHTGWDEGIEPWRFRLPTDYEPRLTTAHSILDRSLFRAGETVHMKHILRKQLMAGFSLVPPDQIPDRLSIEHIGSDQKYELPLQWDAGTSESTWAIPRDAKLGMYGIYLTRMDKQPEGAGRSRLPATPREFSGSFRVEEFRIPLMKAVIRPPARPLVSPSEISVDLAVTYLAGGGAGNLPVRLRSQILGRPVIDFEAFEGFLFSNGKVKEGIFTGEPYYERPETYPVKTMDLTLDRLGTGKAVVAGLPKADEPLQALTELEYKDPNGEIETVSSRIPFYPSERLIGIKPFSWGLTKESLKFQAAVTDLRGNPVAGARVKVDLLERKVYSHRTRLVGGFYSYENSTEIKRIMTFCEGTTDRSGLLFCDKPSPASGNVILQAVTSDEAGRESSVWQSVWVVGDSEWWFAANDEDRIDIIPEKKRYEPGERAKVQVRMPFRNATALVTLEREGVGDTFIRQLSGKEPVIEVPIKASYSPNMYVSVMVVRGRVSGVQPAATVDLGRPAYKLGIAEINVGWRGHELKVNVAADHPVYKVRDKARVAITVKTPEGKVPPPGGEVAVAAVDEGLLELMPNASWNLLEAMMGRRSYGVQTSTAQMHVVGKRHFGLKALPQGGGGGAQVTRELFDTLLLWKGRLALDRKGQGFIEVPLNDSITSFRIVAVATQGVDRYGTGSTSIRSTQDLMILSGISPLVREGDRFRSEFTLRNASERPMKIRVSAAVKELKEQPAPVDVALDPGQAGEIGWDLEAPPGVGALSYELEAREGATVSDRLRVTQKVVPSVPVRTFQATLSQISAPLVMTVKMPGDAIPGRGGIRVAMKPSLAGSMDGVTEYMDHYPYVCLEQNVSKAIVLRDTALWGRIMAQLPSYLDSDGLAKYFPSMALGSEVLTSYILAISHEAGWQIPSDLKQRMTNGLRGFVEGKVIRYSSLPTADLSIRKIAALEAISRTDKIEPGTLSSITIDPNLWPTSAVIDWFNILRRVPAIRSRDARLAEADQILRSRLLFQGTTMGFSTERGDRLWWLMVSTDSNAARLILGTLDSPSWKQDMPRLMRGALGRQKRGRWDTTVANAWGVLAVEKYARAFEKTPVTGTTTIAFGGRSESIDWKQFPDGTAVSFDWPRQEGALSVGMAGTGEPYATVQSLAAIPLKQAISAGFKIAKTVTVVEQKESGVWSKGDIARVRLELESEGDMTWVVVSDPIPAGASIFGTGLGRDSLLATEGERRKGWVWPAFEERSFEAFRSYFEYVPKGKWTIEYTIRLNGRGVMYLPPSRIEALYSPEMFGEIPNPPMNVK